MLKNNEFQLINTVRTVRLQLPVAIVAVGFVMFKSELRFRPLLSLPVNLKCSSKWPGYHHTVLAVRRPALLQFRWLSMRCNHVPKLCGRLRRMQAADAASFGRTWQTPAPTNSHAHFKHIARKCRSECAF